MAFNRHAAHWQRAYRFTCADEAERLAATGLTAGEVGFVCWQQDDDSFWMLKSVGPAVWVPFGGGATGDKLLLE